MSIPESQLETWSHQGAVVTAKRTHESIRKALDSHTWPTGVRKPEVYLQGSYKNTTNIHGDSDVDVVAQLNSTFKRDLSDLSDYQKNLYYQAYDTATYRWKNFRGDVLTALRNYFGSSAVNIGNKSIKVTGNSNRLPADVVACMQYRKYKHFRSLSDENYVEGMVFYTLREGRKVINFPKVHYQNGTEKNGRTSSRYKPTIRIFKNARTYLVNQSIISKELAPSYFLECLLYNVPNGNFTFNYQNTFCNVVSWLQKANMTNFLCQHEQFRLFGNTPEQWSSSDAQYFLQMLVSLWNNWN